MLDNIANGDYNILIRILQGIVSLIIIVSQRNIKVNRKGVNCMGVKVRKKKPAPVDTEQVSKVIYNIRSKAKNEYGIPNHLIMDDGEFFRIRNALKEA